MPDQAQQGVAGAVQHQDSGLEDRSVSSVGPATNREVRSGSCNAIDLGANSPTTTCRKVIITKAMAAEMLCETVF